MYFFIFQVLNSSIKNNLQYEVLVTLDNSVILWWERGENIHLRNGKKHMPNSGVTVPKLLHFIILSIRSL